MSESVDPEARNPFKEVGGENVLFTTSAAHDTANPTPSG